MRTSPRTLRVAGVLTLASLMFAASDRGAGQQLDLQRVIVELSAPEATVVAADAARAAGAAFDPAAHERAVAATQDGFLDALRARGVAFSITDTTLYPAGGPLVKPNRFAHLINAVGLSVPASAVPAIRDMAGVRYVTLDVPLELHLDNSVKYVRANDGPGNKTIFTQGGGAPSRFDGSGQVIAILDTGIDHTHPMFDTRVGDSQFASRTGNPAPVRLAGQPFVAAVNHPKVVYALPLTASSGEDDAGHGTHGAADAAGMKVRAPGLDRLPGTADDPIVEGVAPGALLMNYKLCESIHTCVGLASLVTALTDAVSPADPLGFPKPVATVINMSFGGGGGDPNSANSIAASNAALAGAVPVASAGNAGSNENTVAAPAAGRRVIAVAATNDPGFAANEVDVLTPDAARYTSSGLSTGGQNDASRTAAAEDLPIRAFLMAGAPDVTFPLGQHYVYVGLADTPQQVPAEVNGRIALAVRGSTVSQQGQSTGTFQNKAANVAAKGGIAVLVMNNVPGELEGTSAGTAVIPVYGLSQANGAYLRDTLGFASSINLNDPLTWRVLSKLPVRIGLPDPSTFTPATTVFSSRGPLDAFGLVKPDVTAPGLGVYSATIPYNTASVSTSPVGASPLGMSNATRFISANGTSFSGPHVAGAAALVRQSLLAARGHDPVPAVDLRSGGGAVLQRFQNGVVPPSVVRSALTNTATNLRAADGETSLPDDDARSRIHDIGSGLIHVVRAVDARAAMGTNTLNGVGGPDDAGDPNFLPTHSFGARQVIDTGIATQPASVTVTLQNIAGVAGGGTYALSLVDGSGGANAAPRITRPISGTTGFVVGLGTSAVTLGSALGDRATFTVTVNVDGRPSPVGLAEAGADVTGATGTEFLWWVVAQGSNGTVVRMPFYYRAVKTAVVGIGVPARAPSQNAIQDDATPDQEGGIDRDGNYRLSWTYDLNPNEEQPCGFRIEETGTFVTGFSDAAEEPLLAGQNATWAGNAQWISRPHPRTGSNGYWATYVDQQNVVLTTKNAIDVPAGAKTTLTFDSFEDIELGFDFGFVEAAGASGVFQTLAQYSGSFAGVRSVDLSGFAGQSVKVRFRFQTDELISTPVHAGWFIDDIAVRSADFTVIATVGPSTFTYDITHRLDGTYAYRVTPLFGETCGTAGSSSGVRQITVQGNPALVPTAEFTASPNPALIDETVTFDASASRDNDQGACCITKYIWSFGDGATQTSTGPIVMHAYSAAGSYRVLLVVEDNEGQTANSELLVQVTRPVTSGQASGAGWIVAGAKKANFAFDVSQTATSAAGTLEYNDHATRTKVTATSVTSVFFSGTTAEISGTCTVNKVPGFTFTVTVSDNGSGPTDTFRIQLSNGYEAAGTVNGGNVVITR